MNLKITTKNFDDLYKLKCNPKYVMMLENIIYTFAANKSSNQYKGGSWKSVNVEKEEISFWYFELKSSSTFPFVNENRQKEEIVSSKCFSILCFTFALNYLISYIYEDETADELINELSNLYYLIISNINLVLDENEVEIFQSIID
jgi:hypothetical protein